MSNDRGPRAIPYSIESTDEAITARGGLVLIQEMFDSIGLVRTIDRELPSPGSGRGLPPSSFVIPALLMLHGGGVSLDDLREIKSDTALRTLLSLEHVPASNAVGNWLRRMGGNWDGKDIGDSAGLQGLAAVRRTILSRYLAGVDQITIDIDATVIKAEKRDAKMTYKGFSGYTPLVAFVDGGQAVLWDEFREGSVSPNSRAVEALDACEVEAERLGVRISGLRSDAAYYQAGVFDWAEDRGIGFAIGASHDSAVVDAIDTIPDGDWRPVPDTDREYAEVVHSMNGTKKAFRLVVQRWKKAQEQLELVPYFYHLVATNRSEDGLGIIRWYNQRGSCEDAIGELKHGFGAATLPCGTVEANAVWFRLVTIAYNLGALFSSCLPNRLADKRVGTLRWRLYGTAAKLVRTSRRWILKIAASMVDLFQSIRMRCYRLRHV